MRAGANLAAIHYLATTVSALCLLAGFLVWGPAPAAAVADEPYAQAPAGSSETSSWGYRLAHELMSPFCPGRTLAACSSGQAAELRQWIVLQEAAGASREEVLEILYERFGDVIRSTPPPRGWGLAARALPAAALLLGAGLVFFVLRRLVSRGGEAPAGAAQPPAAADHTPPPAAARADDQSELERQVDEELRASGA